MKEVSVAGSIRREGEVKEGEKKQWAEKTEPVSLHVRVRVCVRMGARACNVPLPVR